MSGKNHLSLLVQSIYVLLTGLQLIFVPNMLLGMFGIEPTTEIWIKVLGVVVLSLALIYYGLKQFGGSEAVRYSAYARLLVAAGFTLLALSGQAPMTLILFAGIDAITGVWTLMELKKTA